MDKLLQELSHCNFYIQYSTNPDGIDRAEAYRQIILNKIQNEHTNTRHN
jgi:hypothetical protein